MDMKEFETEFAIQLKPHGSVMPVISYGIDTKIHQTIAIKDITTLSFVENFTLGQHEFFLIFDNKTNDTPDMAVEILNVTVEKITVDRFKWASTYTPVYPEPWASQQTELLPVEHKSATYLGWNGVWKFQFEVPIFFWIHKLEGLGWVYEPDSRGKLVLRTT